MWKVIEAKAPPISDKPERYFLCNETTDEGDNVFYPDNKPGIAGLFITYGEAVILVDIFNLRDYDKLGVDWGE